MSLAFAIVQLTIFEEKNFKLFKMVLRFTRVVGFNLRYTSLLHQLNEAILLNFAMNSVEVYRSFQNFLFPESLSMFAEFFQAAHCRGCYIRFHLSSESFLIFSSAPTF